MVEITTTHMIWTGVGIASMVASYFFYKSAVHYINKGKKIEEQTNLNFSFNSDLQELDKVVDTIKPPPKPSIDSKEDMIFNKKLIAKKDLVEGEFYFKARPYDYFALRKKWYSPRWWLLARRRKRKAHKIILCRMELNNGKFIERLVEDNGEGFVVDNKRYVPDNKHKYFIIDSNIWAYDFHEHMNFPFKKELKIKKETKELINKYLEQDFTKSTKKAIDLNSVIEGIKTSGITELETSFDPTNLERYFKANTITQLVAGANIAKMYKVMVLLLIITLIVVAVIFVIVLYSSGILNEVGLGGDS